MHSRLTSLSLLFSGSVSKCQEINRLHIQIVSPPPHSLTPPFLWTTMWCHHSQEVPEKVSHGGEKKLTWGVKQQTKPQAALGRASDGRWKVWCQGGYASQEVSLCLFVLILVLPSWLALCLVWDALNTHSKSDSFWLISLWAAMGEQRDFPSLCITALGPISWWSCLIKAPPTPLYKNQIFTQITFHHPCKLFISWGQSIYYPYLLS